MREAEKCRAMGSKSAATADQVARVVIVAVVVLVLTQGCCRRKVTEEMETK